MFSRAWLSRVTGPRRVPRAHVPRFVFTVSRPCWKPPRPPFTIVEPISVAHGIATWKIDSLVGWKNRARVFALSSSRYTHTYKHTHTHGPEERERRRKGGKSETRKIEERQLASVPATLAIRWFQCACLGHTFQTRGEKSWSLTFDGSRLGRPGQRATLFFHGPLFFLLPHRIPFPILPGSWQIFLTRRNSQKNKDINADGCASAPAAMRAVYCLLYLLCSAFALLEIKRVPGHFCQNVIFQPAVNLFFFFFFVSELGRLRSKGTDIELAIFTRNSHVHVLSLAWNSISCALNLFQTCTN